MQRKGIIVLAVIVVSVLLSWIGLRWQSDSVSVVPLSHGALAASPIASATAVATSSGGVAQSASGLDPAIWGALIGLLGVIIGGLIAGGFVIYQVRRNAFLQKKMQEEQFRHDQEMERMRKELEIQYKAREQQEQQAVTEAEALRLKMLLAQTNEERGKAYRQALHADPRISRLQILDMNRPLEITSIYVRVRVHQEVRASYELDPVVRAMEMQHDPNALLREGFRLLERRVSNAIDPDEAIRKYKRCVFVGDPGAGKTTLLKFLTLKAAENQLDKLPDLPILIGLNAFAASGYQDLLDFAAAEWEDLYGFPRADAQAYIEEHLQTGQALLLLDALDETVIGNTAEESEASYQRVADEVMQITTRYPQAPIVVTARKAGYQQRAPLIGFTELEVLDFRLEDIRQFITNWFNSYAEPEMRANGEELKAKLESNPRIQALAANPLLLSLIVIVYEEQLDLPYRRAELYKRCVDTLLTKWDAGRNIHRRREFKPEYKRQLLAELAWHFHQQGRRYFPESEVLNVIADFLPTVHLSPEQNGKILEEIANEQGLLKEQARGWQGFLHLTLQEYFVAQYVIDHQELETLLEHRGDPWWEEVLLLYAGQTPDASPLMSKLIGDGSEATLPEDIFCTNLVLAGHCLATKLTLRQVHLWNTMIDKLFETLLATPYSLIQEHIAEDLAAVGDVEINQRLLHLLADKQLNSFMRGRIALALGKIGEHAVASDLLKLLADEQLTSSVRRNIALALGEIGERVVASDLMELLVDEQLASSVRIKIALALGEIGERTVASDLVKLLVDEHLASSVRIRIALALGEIGERTVAADLLKLLADEQLASSVRMSIAEVLGKLGERAVAADLVKLLGDNQLDRSVRMRVALALGKIGEKAVATDLVKLLVAKQLDSFVCESIALALGELSEPTVAADLMKLLVNEQLDLSVRGSIALALGKIGERTVATDLVKLLADEQLDRFVRVRIALALGEIGERAVATDLVKLLADEQLDRFVRESIALAIGKLKERAVVADLLKLLVNEQLASFVRIRIAQALGEIGEPTVAADLVKLLADEHLDRFVRGSVALTLGKIGGPVASDLLKLLADEPLNRFVRERIALALGRLGGRVVVADLVKLLADGQLDRFVRVRVTLALGEIGERAVIADLVKLLADEQLDLSVRLRTALALGKMGDRSVAADLLKLLADEQLDFLVRGSIVEALGQLGERAVVADLVKLLDNRPLDRFVRRSIASALETLVQDEATVRSLVTLLPTSDIADSIHHTLWTISRRIGVRIFMIDDGAGEKQIKIVKW
ncbi:MAG TPA: HEAT repeat domain-containing protein [Ktedonobacteraceae bacterium]|nr:HEAT repeat domain-containing protein [Ktedonobacteraceae bacterium]